MKICAMEWESVCGTDLSFSEIEKLGEVSYHGRVPDEKLVETIGDSEVLLCSKIPVTASLLDSCPRLKYVGLTATGYNNVDVSAAAARGVTVTNIPDYSAAAVSQMTLALMLSLTLSLPDYFASTARGDWTRSKLFCYYPYPMTELFGKTLGLFGLGSIGGRVAALGQTLGMRVIYHARTKKDLPYEYVSKEEVFRQSDVVSLHLPLSEETKGLICSQTLSLMKPTAFLINTSRGGLVKEEDLRRALDEGWIAGFAADVLETEPQREDCPLIGAKNCLLTPHVAWAPVETRKRLIGILTENLASYLKGEPQNVVKG